MNEIIALFISEMELATLSMILGDVKNVVQFTHFHQFCFNFIGKDEVFHGLLCPYVAVV